MKHRVYKLRISGSDTELVTFLRKYVPDTYEALNLARERGRAIELLFPKVQVEYLSLYRPVPKVEKVRTL